jgi:hypothetical protein
VKILEQVTLANHEVEVKLELEKIIVQLEVIMKKVLHLEKLILVLEVIVKMKLELEKK